MTDIPDDVVVIAAKKLAMFMVDTWGDAEGVIWTGLSNRSKIKAMTAARAALEAAKWGEMRGAIEALGAMPEGYCFCSKDRIGDDSKVHEPECADLRALLSSIGASQQ